MTMPSSSWPSMDELTSYKPAPEVVRQLGSVKLYAVVAPYSSGKDSIVEWLIKNHGDKFTMVVGDTSRQRRQTEAEGVEHYFRSKAEMAEDLQAGRFVQVVPGFAGDFYATRPWQYSSDKINLKPIQARAMANFKRLGFKEVQWLQVVPSSYENWVNWRAKRNYHADDLRERTAEAIESYELALKNSDTHFILNDKVQEAASRIMCLAAGQSIPDEAQAKRTAIQILEVLKHERA